MAATTSNPLLRVGAWGQLSVIGLAVVFWVLELATPFLVACLGYVVITMAGIVGIARTKSAIVGPFVFPFLIPGFVPLYYFALWQAPAPE